MPYGVTSGVGHPISSPAPDGHVVGASGLVAAVAASGIQRIGGARVVSFAAFRC